MSLGDRFSDTLAAARAGDDAAWVLIYRDLSPALLGYLKARRAVAAEDLLGEVFLQMVTGISRFEGDEREFRAWAFTVTRNRLIDSRRRSARRVAEIPVEPDEENPGGDVEQEALDRLGTEGVRSHLNDLSQDQQDVLLLRILGDLSLPEIAGVLNKRLGAVKALQRRGLARLRKEISD